MSLQRLIRNYGPRVPYVLPLLSRPTGLKQSAATSVLHVASGHEDRSYWSRRHRRMLPSFALLGVPSGVAAMSPSEGLDENDENAESTGPDSSEDPAVEESVGGVPIVGRGDAAVRRATADAMLNRLAVKTRKAYDPKWKLWKGWCAEHTVYGLASSVDTITSSDKMTEFYQDWENGRVKGCSKDYASAGVIKSLRAAMAKRLEYQQALGLPGVMVGKLADEVKYGKLMHQKAKQSTTLDRKNGGHDWLSDTTADRLSCAEVIKLSEHFLSEHATSSGKGSDWAMPLASRAGFLSVLGFIARSDDTRDLKYAGHHMYELPATVAGPTPCKVMAVVIRDSKTNKGGNVEIMAAARHKDYRVCCVGSTIDQMVTRMYLKARGDGFPDFFARHGPDKNRRSWYLRCLFPVTQPPTKPAAAAKTATHFEIEEVVESFIEARERGVSGDAGPSSAPGPSNRLQTSGASLSSPGARSNSGGAGASSGAGGSSMETGMEPATASTAKSRAEISNKLTKLMTPLSYDAFYNNMRAAKKACEVNCSEVLHARGSRVLDLIRNGVDRDTVRAAGRWTENGDAFELNYANEFPPDAILGCAGFDHASASSTYRIARAVEVPDTLRKLVFPEAWAARVKLKAHNASCPVNQKDLTAEKFATFLCDWASDVFCQDGALKHRLLRGRGRLFTHKVFAHKDWKAFAERVYAAEDAAPPSLPGLEAAAPLLAMELTAIRLHNRAMHDLLFSVRGDLKEVKEAVSELRASDADREVDMDSEFVPRFPLPPRVGVAWDLPGHDGMPSGPFGLPSGPFGLWSPPGGSFGHAYAPQQLHSPQLFAPVAAPSLPPRMPPPQSPPLPMMSPTPLPQPCFPYASSPERQQQMYYQQQQPPAHRQQPPAHQQQQQQQLLLQQHQQHQQFLQQQVVHQHYMQHQQQEYQRWVAHDARKRQRGDTAAEGDPTQRRQRPSRAAGAAAAVGAHGTAAVQDDALGAAAGGVGAVGAAEGGGQPPAATRLNQCESVVQLINLLNLYDTLSREDVDLREGKSSRQELSKKRPFWDMYKALIPEHGPTGSVGQMEAKWLFAKSAAPMNKLTFKQWVASLKSAVPGPRSGARKLPVGAAVGQGSAGGAGAGGQGPHVGQQPGSSDEPLPFGMDAGQVFPVGTLGLRMQGPGTHRFELRAGGSARQGALSAADAVLDEEPPEGFRGGRHGDMGEFGSGEVAVFAGDTLFS